MTWPDHFCPGCGAPQRAFPRYPWHFCKGCLASATDRDGRRLKFGNAAMSGGLSWHYDGDEPGSGGNDIGAVLCLIHNRRVLVTEARFGGVVAQPVTNSPIPQRHVDLSRN